MRNGCGMFSARREYWPGGHRCLSARDIESAVEAGERPARPRRRDRSNCRHEDTTRRLDTDGLEELRVPVSVMKGPKLNELTDLSHLLAAALLKTRHQ